MNVLIDTSAFSEYGRGNNNELKAWFKAENQLVMSLIVIGEIRAGFAAGNRRSENEKILQKFLDAPNVVTVGLNDKTTHEFSDIYLQLRKAGTPIGANDMWIASIAKELDLTVLTTDTDFGYIEGLKLIKVKKAVN
jgi:tRNA(fMet)-specific endonuclease VapC